MQSAILSKIVQVLQVSGGYLATDGLMSATAPDSAITTVANTGQVNNPHQLTLEIIKVIGGITITLATRYIDRKLDKRRTRRRTRRATTKE